MSEAPAIAAQMTKSKGNVILVKNPPQTHTPLLLTNDTDEGLHNGTHFNWSKRKITLNIILFNPNDLIEKIQTIQLFRPSATRPAEKQLNDCRATVILKQHRNGKTHLFNGKVIYFISYMNDSWRCCASSRLECNLNSVSCARCQFHR